jgi:hypothetical protein
MAATAARAFATSLRSGSALGSQAARPKWGIARREKTARSATCIGSSRCLDVSTIA